MYIKFWGTRGSIPISLSVNDIRHKVEQALKGAAGLDLTNDATLKRYLDRLPFSVLGTVGGNTTCVEVRSGNQILIIDAGSGLRLLGADLMQRGFVNGGCSADILVTHTHWDHIHGFPFFRPAFIADNRITFYSPFSNLAQRLTQQQHPDFFPVPISYMSAHLKFTEIQANQWLQIGNLKICPMELSHPGTTYGYRIEDDHSCLVFASDSEYKRVDPTSTEAYVDFFHNADLLVFDAQYSLSEVLDKPDWGHSTPIMGAELAFRAQVKQLALFHHDPTSSDEKIIAGKEQAEAYLLRRHPKYTCNVLVAYDGLELEL